MKQLKGSMSVADQLKLPMVTQLCLSCQQELGEQEVSKMDLFGGLLGDTWTIML